MKREDLGRIFMILVIFSISIVYAQNFIPNESDYNSISKIKGNFYQTLNNSDSNPTIATKSTMRALSSNLNSITLLNPEAGYYYITDEMLLWITTANPSSCTYTFNSEKKNMIDNQTDHYEYISGLTDNMASEDPYVVDFSCNDGSGTTTASTYFWINTTDLDKYFIRNDLGYWKYLSSEKSWWGNDSGLLEYFNILYQKNSEEIYDNIFIAFFDSTDSLKNFIQINFLDSLGNSIMINTIDGKNVYVYDYEGSKNVLWTSGNYLIRNKVFTPENNISEILQIPGDIIDPYLLKYPDDLRYGVCGDGKVNVFNLDGKKEDCDKNSEMTSCGSNVGECKIGQKTRKCKSDCTWDIWGPCNATLPKAEICDNKDNDCDGKIDEDFTLLNRTCYVGVGACRQEGKYICSLTGFNVSCNAVSKAPQQENCSDEQDNDCDSLIDFNDTKDCIPLKINSPINGFYYPNKNILFDIFSSYNPNDIIYSYFDIHGKEVIVRLCSKCNTYNKTKSFNDGFYNLTIAISNKSQIFSKKQLSFLVDSTPPKISKTLPKKGFTNGNFSIKFKENNPKILTLNYDNQKKNLNISKECIIEKGFMYCNTKVNLSIFDGKEIRYYFNLTDITGKNTFSKPINLTADTTKPIINSFVNTADERRVTFTLNITEFNFDEVNYIDYNNTRPTEKTLCSSLRNGICTSIKTFSTGNHNITITVLDKAGNYAEKKVNFKI